MKSAEVKRQFNNNGFSLVEVLVAIIVLAIISLPVLSTFSNAARMNNKARRIDNANTIANNILEETRGLTLKQLAAGQGSLTYEVGNTSSAVIKGYPVYFVGDTRDSNNKLYCKGADGEPFYVSVEFDPDLYTTDSGDDPSDSVKNNINSKSMSVYTDIGSGNNYVYRDDNSDEQAVSHFEYYAGSDFKKALITKTTDVTVTLKINEDATTLNSIPTFTQNVVITVTYHYNSTISYPDYTRNTTMTSRSFEAKEVTDNEDKKTYYVSTKLDDNAWSLYIFYTPFDDFDNNKTINTNNRQYVDDVVNISYEYPSTPYLSYTIDYSDLAIYFLQQEKTATYGAVEYHMDLDKSNIKVKFNGTEMDTDAEKAGSNADNVVKKEKAVRIYSNVKDWESPTQSQTAQSLYRIKITIWYRDPTMSDDSAIVTTITSTKPN